MQKTNKKITPKNETIKKLMSMKCKPMTAGIVAVVLALIGGLYMRTSSLQKQNEALVAQIQQAKKVYVYNLEEVVVGAGIVEMQQKFEKQVKQLNDEVTTAQKKIKSFKNAKVKEDFSDMYLKSLVLKRDEMIGEYEKAMKQATENVNNALRKVAEQVDAPTIYHTKSVSVNTKYVTDVTKEIVEYLNKNKPTEKSEKE